MVNVSVDEYFTMEESEKLFTKVSSKKASGTNSCSNTFLCRHKTDMALN